MSACWPLQIPPTPKAVLISLADNANDHGVCWPSISTICARTCFGKTAVIEAIQWLESAGFLVADRENGRHTKYQIIPAGRDLFSPQPVREANRSAKRTGSADGPDLSASRKKPVRQADTNRQEPSGTIERENAGAQGGQSEGLPPGVDPEKWELFRQQLDHDGKTSAPRILNAMGQLRALAKRGVDCNAVLSTAVARGWRDLTDAGREVQRQAAGAFPRAGPTPAPAAPRSPSPHVGPIRRMSEQDRRKSLGANLPDLAKKLGITQ